MTLLDTTEQEAFRNAVRRFLSVHADEAAVRRWIDTEPGFDREVWSSAASQLGLPGLLVPESHGGSGAGPVELADVFEEAGGALYAPPLLSTGVLATVVLLSSDDESACSELLPQLANGTLVAAVADHRSHTGAVRSEDSPMQAVREGGSWSVSGVARHVVCGQRADILLIPAVSDEGLSLFAVNCHSNPAVRVVPLKTLDLTRQQADIQLESAPARPIGDRGRAARAIDEAFTMGALAVAAEAVGGADKVVGAAVEHATNRVQFGRPIGAFQSIKHRCADMKLLLEASRAAVRRAAHSMSDDSVRRTLDVSVAKVYACDAFFRIAADNIQIHGGIGCTWEHPAHLYFRRAKSLQQLLGTSAYHRSLVAEELHL